MLKRAQCQVAREHQQTMASVVLGCRGCHQTGECGSGCQGAPTGWQTWCQAVRGRRRSSPGNSSSPWWGCSINLQGRSGNSAQQSAAARSAPSCHRQAQSPCCHHTSSVPGPLAPGSGSQEGPGSHQAHLMAAAPLRRSLRQHPHGCQSSGDNELLMCLKSDAGCMARS